MVYYVDPQSYSNLAVYDHSLITNMRETDVVFYCSVKYDHAPFSHTTVRSVFSYSDQPTATRKMMSYARSMLTILRDAWRERPDVIHIQWIRLWPVDYMLVLILHALGIRVIHTAHNVLPHNPRARDKQLFTLYYKAVDAIIVHSHRTKDELVAMAGVKEKVKVIHHGMLPATVDDKACSEKMNELRRTYRLTDKSVVFACMGSQNKYKGTEIVFQAWKESDVLKKDDCHLFVVGKNENIEYDIVEGITNVHIIKGHIPDIDFHAIMRLSSVILLPYLKISQSGVLFTALQTGVPVLVSDVGGLAEPLQVADVGWNIGAPEVDTLQQTMEHLAANPQLIAEKKNNTAAFDKVRQAYSWKDIAKETETLYHEEKKQTHTKK